MRAGKQRGQGQFSRIFAWGGITVALIMTLSATAAECAARERKTDTSTSGARVPVTRDKLTPIEVGHVELAGLLGKHVYAVPARLLGGQCEAYLKVFENPSDTNGWRAEHIGKWLETACNTMTHRHDGKLRSKLGAVVARLIQLQQADGWLGSYGPEFRFYKYDWAANADIRNFRAEDDKHMPPPKEGAFNVYSEDGLGKDVRVQFPIATGNPFLN